MVNVLATKDYQIMIYECSISKLTELLTKLGK